MYHTWLSPHKIIPFTWPNPADTWPPHSHMSTTYTSHPSTWDHLVHTTTSRLHMTTHNSNIINQFTRPYPGCGYPVHTRPPSRVTVPFTSPHPVLTMSRPPHSHVHTWPPNLHITLYTWPLRSHDHIPFTRDHPIHTTASSFSCDYLVHTRPLFHETIPFTLLHSVRMLLPH